MQHVIRYVLNTKILGLKLEPFRDASKPQEIECFCDIDYAGDPISRRTLGVFILCVLSVPVSWQSEVQRSIVTEFRGWVGSVIRGCKESYVHDSVVEMHENFG